MTGRRSKRERGVALLIALFALMLLAAVAFQMMYVADVETAVNDNFRTAQRAYAAAWSGLQEARERLMPSNALPHLIIGPAALPGGPNTIIYVRNPGQKQDGTLELATDIDPTNPANRYFDDEFCHENFVGPALPNPGVGIPCTVGPPAGNVQYINSDTPFTATTGALDYKWVRITMKANNTVNPGPPSTYGLVTGSTTVNGLAPPAANQVEICWDGQAETPRPPAYVQCSYTPPATPPAPGTYMKTVYVVTALAVTQTGARRMAQMEVALQPPFVTNAAVDSQDHVNLNGQLTVSAFDSCNCILLHTCDNQGKNPGSGVKACNPCPTCYTGPNCDGSKYAIYSSNTVDNPGASETIVSGNNTPPYQPQQPPPPGCPNPPSPQPAGQPVASCAAWPYNISDMINTYKQGAVNAAGPPYNYTCTGSPANCGTQNAQTFGVPPTFPPNPPGAPVGPPNMTPDPGQITYVPGNLKITAGSVGNGILIVDGDLNINGGLQFYGLILVKGVVSFTGGGANPTNIYGAVLAGQESLVDTTLGGSAVIDYDSCALTRGTGNRPPSSIAFRELSY